MTRKVHEVSTFQNS